MPDSRLTKCSEALTGREERLVVVCSFKVELRGSIEGVMVTEMARAILAAHKIEVSDSDRASLTEETDEKTLEKWLQHAASVKSTAELFAV